MANIFEGVPWLGIPETKLNFYEKFAAARDRRDQREQFDRRMQFEERKQAHSESLESVVNRMRDAQARSYQLQGQEAEAKLEAMHAKKLNDIDSISALTSLSQPGPPLGSPERDQWIMGFVQKNPSLMIEGTPGYTFVQTLLKANTEFANMQNALAVKNAGDRDRISPEMLKLRDLGKIKMDINRIKAEGGDATSLEEDYNRMEAMIATSGIDMQFGADGKLLSISHGKGKRAAGGFAPSVESAIQEKVLGLSDLANKFGTLDESLTKDAIGLRGIAFGEFGNKFLAQGFPEFYKGDVADARIQIANINEDLLKSMKSAGPLTDKDAVRLKKALVDLGPIESYENVVQWKNFWKREIGSMGAAKVATMIGEGESDIRYEHLLELTSKGGISSELAAAISIHLGIALPLKRPASQQPAVPSSLAPPPR